MVLLLCGMFAGCASVPKQADSSCEAATNGAVALHRYITRLVTAPDADTTYASTRERYGLPSSDSTAVFVVADGRQCDEAAAKYASLRNLPVKPRRVILIGAGDRRVIVDPYEQNPRSEFRVVVVFDSSWRKLAAFTM